MWISVFEKAAHHTHLTIKTEKKFDKSEIKFDYLGALTIR